VVVEEVAGLLEHLEPVEEDAVEDEVEDEVREVEGLRLPQATNLQHLEHLRPQIFPTEAPSVAA
jgi:hypothetical protein